MEVMITGAAGFIGATLAHCLLDRGDTVIGVDNLNDYYDVNLKRARLARLTERGGFTDLRLDIQDREAMETAFAEHKPRRVVHLAAEAGVRHSLQNPHAFIGANVTGFLHVLEGCRHHEVEHLVYASTSSVYGANTNLPYSVRHGVDHPVSLYAASKKANEMMAHTYSHLYRLPTTGLRFFTVYGPWGRPDMVPFVFANKMLAGEPIDIFNHGDHSRDFTYVDDIIEGVTRTLDHVAEPDPGWSGDRPEPHVGNAPYRIYNIGRGEPVELMRFIEVLEDCLGMQAKKNFLPMQPGDVAATCADVTELARDVGYRPDTPVETGVENFVRWYREYYKV